MASSDASSRSSIIPQHTEQVITDLDPKRTSISNKLFLETSTPTSASPYPSPSSAFYPPPIPASHEFANKIASNKRYRGLNHAAINNATSNSPITAIASGTAKGEPSTDGKGNPNKTNGRFSPNSALSPTSSLGLEGGVLMDQRRASDAFLSQNSSASPAGRAGRSLSDAPRPSTSGDLGTSKSSDGMKEVPPQTGGPKQDEVSLSDEKHLKNTKDDNLAGASTKQETTEDPKASTSVQIISKEEPPSETKEPESQATTTGLLTPSAPSFLPMSDLTQTITVTPELLPDSTPNKRNSLASSLHSSRPAPPSPAPSRRGSLVRRGSSTRRSTYSNTSSRDANSSRGEIIVDKGDDPKASRRQSRLSMSFNPLSMTEEEGRARSQEPSQSEGKEEILPSPPKPIIVRDFAFPEDDERFSQVPLELLPLDEREKRLQGQAHDRYDDEYEGWDDEDEDGNWDHRWRYEDAELTPLAQMTHSTGGDYDGGSHYTYTETGAPDLLSPDLPLQPGIYRALYPFEAEGTAEMSLDEGQLVKVIGRGGGVGWAVVERGWHMTAEELGKTNISALNQDSDGGNGALALAGQALVPEGYLEPYRLDSS